MLPLRGFDLGVYLLDEGSKPQEYSALVTRLCLCPEDILSNHDVGHLLVDPLLVGAVGFVRILCQKLPDPSDQVSLIFGRDALIEVIGELLVG